jgi:four helix bundle protein
VTDFDHERLDVYRASTEFLLVGDEVADNLPRGRAYLADQLRRAAVSICLNIAEGAGEFASADKARFYRIARRSATECAAILDAARILKLSPDVPLATGRSILARVVAMLTALALRLEPGAGSGTGSGSGGT